MSIFIIAEIGINHNGNLDLAKKLIDASVDAGADAVKFQKRTIDLVYTKEFLDGLEKVRGVQLNVNKKKALNLALMTIRKLIHIAKKLVSNGLLLLGI